VRAAQLITRDRSLAEDVVQAAFLRAFERIGQFDTERPFGPWFLRSVVNDAIKAATKRERQVPLEHIARDASVSLADSAPGPERLIEQAETSQELRAALDSLSPAQRAVIVQRYYLGLSEAEMADALACPPGTIKSRLHTARERLRVLLRPHQSGLEPPP
ncbi:MAG TPA: sigma-70 family RNA polymerase sigma factor, partial [Thermomicrobiales bacterium]|nr:sigma-70 family RNA polymerase sigma factor [Thermomicrobiales bacterium]